jgi:endonuclease III
LIKTFSELSIEEIIRRLETKYGNIRRNRLDPISELVLTIISQNTSDINSRPAFKSLQKAFPDWYQVAEANPKEIANAIHAGGLENIKAARIKLVLNEILRQHGKLDLNFLKKMPLDEAKAWLKQLPGVGPKTAACVLLFSLDMPALPVDTHIYRVTRRLGLVSAKTSAENAHDILESLVPAKNILRFHLLLIEHGRRQCTARRPNCLPCPLFEGCPFGQSALYSSKS